MIDLEQAFKIVQSHLDVGNQTEDCFGKGNELLVAQNFVFDLEYGWHISFSMRGNLEGWPGIWDLAGGRGPFVVLRGQGEVFRPKEYSLEHLAP